MGYYDDDLQDPWDAADKKWDEQKEEYKIKQHEELIKKLRGDFVYFVETFFPELMEKPHLKEMIIKVSKEIN